MRRPSVLSNNEIVFQDFLYHTSGTTELRYLLAKYDGEQYENVGETFDYVNPQHSGGSEISRIDYTLEGKLITIDNWEVYWRDEWPLRLSLQHLSNCLYSKSGGYLIRVGDEARAFWVSEAFTAISNAPGNYLLKV